MHAFGAKVTPRAPVHTSRRLNGVSAPPRQSASQWRPTRLIANHGRLALYRAATARDLGPGCYVLKTAQSNSDIPRALLRREALVASQVSHPSLISVLADECDAPVPHVVLPYLEGITLRRLLDSLPILPLSFALGIVRQIAAALASIHAAGWLHGQVRPEHVIISPQGHTTLIDLTLARRLESSECDATGALPASLAYAAPETTSSHGRITAAADAYALGIVFYEALTGQPPFQQVSPQLVMRSHLRDAMPDMRALRADVSLEVAELCRRMLAKEPLRRPAASQVVQWLAELEIEELAI